MKHTPGFWNIDFEVSEDGPAIAGPDGQVHVQVYGKRAKPDAHLIAASPDLLRAAIALEKAICQKPIIHVSTKTLNCLNELRRAIAKAKGKL